MVLEPKTDTQLGGSVCTTHRPPRLALFTDIERPIQAELSQSFSVLPDKHSLPQVKAKSKNLLAWNLSTPSCWLWKAQLWCGECQRAELLSVVSADNCCPFALFRASPASAEPELEH